MLVDSSQIVLLAALAQMSPATVTRAYSGRRIEVSTRARLELAAKQLGLPPPPAAAPQQDLRSASLNIQAKR